jgi:hypothetical protein
MTATTTASKSKWVIYASLTGIEMETECLAMRRENGTTAIVRATTSGEFAVIAIDGSWAKVLKTLPTLDRARAYLAAVVR